MTRYVYDADLDCMVRKSGRNYFDWSEKRSDLPCPAIQPGSMPEIQSMVDGKRYETKRNYYRSVERAGCAIIGHDKPESMERVISRAKADKEREQTERVHRHVQRGWEESASRVPSYGPEARRLMRKQRRQERETV
jgi:hypothetical protein